MSSQTITLRIRRKVRKIRNHSNIAPENLKGRSKCYRSGTPIGASNKTWIRGRSYLGRSRGSGSTPDALSVKFTNSYMIAGYEATMGVQSKRWMNEKRRNNKEDGPRDNYEASATYGLVIPREENTKKADDIFKQTCSGYNVDRTTALMHRSIAGQVYDKGNTHGIMRNA
ncbi:hypothetical protein Tco_0494861 [Tanacetum coccineum]